MDSNVQKMTTSEIEAYDLFAIMDDDDAQSRDCYPPEWECNMADSKQVANPAACAACRSPPREPSDTEQLETDKQMHY